MGTFGFLQVLPVIHTSAAWFIGNSATAELCNRHYLLLDSRKSWELINFNDTCAWNLDLQCIQVLKEAIYHYAEGQQTNMNGRRSIFTERKGCANEFRHER